MKKFKFRLQVVLDMREKELEQRQMEMAKIVAALNLQQEKLQNILQAQDNNTSEMEALYSASELEFKSKDLFGTELKRQSIYLVALGKRKQYKGFDFKYV